MMTVKNDDIFVVSYPKSGNTWVRFVLATLRKGEALGAFSDLERWIPDMYAHHNGELAQYPTPRLIKSHEPLDVRYGKVLYLVRDPRDVAISYFHHLKRVGSLGTDTDPAEWVPQFLEGNFHPYGSWSDHVGGWIGARGERDDFLCVKYEDLVDNPEAHFNRIVSFLEIEATPEWISRAIELNTVEKMRSKEEKKKSGFVRKGRPGSWREELPEASVRTIETACFQHMSELGYDASSL
jgi:hypothetical protein